MISLSSFLWTYALSIGIIKSLELDNVRVSHNTHDLQLTVLPLSVLRYNSGISVLHSHLEAFILQYSFDSGIFPVRSKLRLKHYTKRTVSYDLTLGILHFPSFASDTILNFLTYYFY